MVASGEHRAVSVRDVAALAKVSLGTVSNVLNHPEAVSAATQARVQAAMAELGFVRNESARQLRAGRSRTLGYVMLDGSNPFFTDVARGIEEEAEANDLSLYMCNSDNRAERELSYLSRLEQQRVQGILITPSDANAPILDELPRRGTPLVIVDRTREADTHCSVAVDDVLGGELAVDHLVELGHERIAFVGGPTSIGQVRERREGAFKALAKAGLDPDRLVEVETNGLTVAEGRGAGERLAGLPVRGRPSAVFCANDLLALGLLQQCVSMRIRVPEDLAIVGYDDIEFASAAAVPLTSVRQPRRQLGRTAAALLLRETRDRDHRHEKVLFTPELVVRRSTRS
ncbi:LacI family DNA-binding transcriptional regulator [Actinophytocola xanthii]|uniref:LacI family transcriptional regulator n=1 Tax=Actinophytocola xanthii TaxID=1912961 RepID=A0A1Q8CPS4_9PSEU|nr:LacI family DNA-binding transcriptional regulator [Actinophytocola xanthii]OLF16349.1 LacI family transcriptional regulator [Actinophytocola xanthii]